MYYDKININYNILIKIHEKRKGKWKNYFLSISSFRIKYVLSRNDRRKIKMHIIYFLLAKHNIILNIFNLQRMLVHVSSMYI
jgi:hypothetical protein